MTGYGVGVAPLGAGRIVAELKAVNHRHVDVRLRAPSGLVAASAKAEETIRRRLLRGRIEAVIRFEGDVCGPLRLDVARARSAFEQFAALRDSLCPGEAVPLSLLAIVPDLFDASRDLDAGATSAAVLIAVVAACDDLDAMRQREGASIEAELERRLDRIEARAKEAREVLPRLIARYDRRLHDRIRRLLEGCDATLDERRIEQEVALLAERVDIAEEVARLDSHVAQARGLVGAEEPLVGRKLDFLMQEMSREANTLGAKAAQLGLTALVVELKADIDRVREQVQNVL